MRIIFGRFLYAVARLLNIAVVALLIGFAGRAAIQFRYPEIAAKAATGSEMGTSAMDRVASAVFRFTNPLYDIIFPHLPEMKDVDLPLVAIIVACLFFKWFVVGMLNDFALRILVGPRNIYVA